MKSVMTIVIFLFLTGCQQNQNTYYWGDYTETLYTHYQDMSSDSLDDHKETLLEIIEVSNDEGSKVPPATYFELGYIEMSHGNISKGKGYLYKERELYPESVEVVNILLTELDYQ